MLARLVAVLGDSAPSAAGLAAHIRHDAPLALTIFKCARASGKLQTAQGLEGAVDILGTDFIRMLVLAAKPAVAPVATWETGIRVAHLARQIAVQTHLCDPELAWLTGLAHNLHEYPQYAVDAAQRDLGLFALDGDGFAADAVRYCRAAPARIKSAHPLVRILQLAVSLVYSAHVNGNVSVVGLRAALSGLGLEAAEATRLQAECENLVRQTLHDYGAVLQDEGDTSGQDNATQQPHAGLLRGYAAMARAGALNEMMGSEAEPEALAQRLTLLMLGVFGIRSSVLLKKQVGELKPVSWWPEATHLSRLPVLLSDAQSAICIAAAGEPTRWAQEQAEQYPVIDAQLARLMGVTAMLCTPLGEEHVLIAGDAPASLDADGDWLMFLRTLAARMETLERRSPPPTSLADDVIPRQEVRRVVHEAANPLTIIRNYVDLLSGKFARDSETQRDLSIIGSEIERVGAILQGLGARPEPVIAAQENPGTWVDVNQIISELVRMSLDTLFLPNKINVQIDLDPGMGSILTQRDPLKQVLLNLAKNAVEAMPRGGRLTFATARVEHENHPAVVIAVRDTGPGLPEEVRAHLFQPVTSFKGGDHAGLGLTISQNLVQSMGGSIEYDNSPGGATFKVYLPMTSESGAALQSRRT